MLVYREIISTESRVSESYTSYAVNKPGLNRQQRFNFTDKVRNGNGLRDPSFSENRKNEIRDIESRLGITLPAP